MLHIGQVNSGLSVRRRTSTLRCSFQRCSPLKSTKHNNCFAYNRKDDKQSTPSKSSIQNTSKKLFWLVIVRINGHTNGVNHRTPFTPMVTISHIHERNSLSRQHSMIRFASEFSAIHRNPFKVIHFVAIVTRRAVD